MQSAGYLTVNGTRTNFLSVPNFLCMFWCSLGEYLITKWFTIFHQTSFCHLMSYIIDVSSFGLNTELCRQTQQFLRIFYFVVSIRSRLVQSMRNLTSMVRMGSRTTCCKAKIVSSYNTMHITSADTTRCFFGDTARTHRTNSTADTRLTKFTVWSLIFYTQLPGVCTHFGTCLQQSLSRRFKFFHCS